MMYISDTLIEQLIKEDLPYIDLTTSLMGIGGREGQISFAPRQDIVAACTEEVARLMKKLDITVDSCSGSGCPVKSGDTFLTAHGRAASLHMAWKVSQNILEYCCGIATRTKLLVDTARAVNPNISIITTRKSFPGTKELSLKSIIAGGAFPHRLGLSETILIFRQHINFLNNFEDLSAVLKTMRTNACEKKIIIEAENENEAMQMAMLDIDGIQFDKIPAVALKDTITRIRRINPGLVFIAAGGINVKNAAEYAAAGIDTIATTSVYFGRPADIKTTIKKTA